MLLIPDARRLLKVYSSLRPWYVRRRVRNRLAVISLDERRLGAILTHQAPDIYILYRHVSVEHLYIVVPFQMTEVRTTIQTSVMHGPNSKAPGVNEPNVSHDSGDSCATTQNIS
jgi:hypothetical protein